MPATEATALPSISPVTWMLGHNFNPDKAASGEGGWEVRMTFHNPLALQEWFRFLEQLFPLADDAPLEE